MFDLARSCFMDVHRLIPRGSIHLALKLLCPEQCLAYSGIESLNLVRWTQMPWLSSLCVLLKDRVCVLPPQSWPLPTDPHLPSESGLRADPCLVLPTQADRLPPTEGELCISYFFMRGFLFMSRLVLRPHILR